MKQIDYYSLESCVESGELSKDFNPKLDDLEILRYQNEIQFIYHKGMDDELILTFFTLWDIVIDDHEDERRLLESIGINVPLPDYDTPGGKHEKTSSYLKAIQDGLLEMKSFLKSPDLIALGILRIVLESLAAGIVRIKLLSN